MYDKALISHEWVSNAIFKCQGITLWYQYTVDIKENHAGTCLSY